MISVDAWLGVPFGSAYVGERWTSALVFVILIASLVFRPAGLLGTHTREKV